MKTSRPLLGLVAGCTVLWGLCLLAQEPVKPAAEPVATVVAVRGDVAMVRPDGTSAKLQLKSEIPRGSTVKTGERGRIQIRFPDETLISLGRNTTMTIEEFTYQPSEGQGKLVTQINEGVFRVMGGAITKIAPENFQTKTPTATIGIRGSFYSGRINAGRLEVVFLGGRGITVTNARGGVEITTPSFGTIVTSADDAPAEPAPFSAAQLNGLGGDHLGDGDNGDDNGDNGGGDLDGGDDNGGGEDLNDLDDGINEDSSQQGVEDAHTAGEQQKDDIEKQIEATATPPPDMPFGTPPPDTVPWNGFAVGTPGGSRGVNVYRNTDSSQFVLHRNEVDGRVAAGGLIVTNGADTLSLPNATDNGSTLGTVNATLTGSGGAGGSLSSTPLPASINPEWMNWGYWQASRPSPSLTIPAAGVTQAAAQWVAGVLTPTSYIQNMRTGSYSGAARCVEFPSAGGAVTHVGTSVFNLDFATNPHLTGSMNYPGLTMAVEADVNSNWRGFNGAITSVSTGGPGVQPTSSQLQGDFFGPQANALGAVFQADMANGTTYLGAAAAAKP